MRTQKNCDYIEENGFRKNSMCELPSLGVDDYSTKTKKVLTKTLQKVFSTIVLTLVKEIKLNNFP